MCWREGTCPIVLGPPQTSVLRGTHSPPKPQCAVRSPRTIILPCASAGPLPHQPAHASVPASRPYVSRFASRTSLSRGSNEDEGESGAPKVTILERFWPNSCQSCQRQGFPLKSKP